MSDTMLKVVDICLQPVHQFGIVERWARPTDVTPYQLLTVYTATGAAILMKL